MQRVEHLMGMPILVDVPDDAVDERVVDNVFGWFRWVDRVFSTYKSESEISRINRGELEVCDADQCVVTVLGLCEEARATTDGYFDVRASSPDVLDPSGLVKGWSVDRAAALLDSAGVRRYAVNAGGDLVVRGGGWTIGIQHPLERDDVARVLEVGDLAVATSGTYERGFHVVDPRRGEPARALRSVTVAGPDLGTADAYATGAMAMGRPALGWLATLADTGYESGVVTADGRAYRSDGFPAAAPEPRKSARTGGPSTAGSAAKPGSSTDGVEDRIDELEAEVRRIEEQLADHETYDDPNRVARLAQSHEDASRRLRALYQEWEQAAGE